MKLPKSFRPDKNLEDKTEQLIKNPKSLIPHDPEKVLQIVKKSEYYLDQLKAKHRAFVDMYRLATWLTEDLKYTQPDIEEFTRNIMKKEEDDKFLGFYLSALINKIIQKDDIMNLTLNTYLTGVGAYLQKGTMIVEGNAGRFTGYGMEDGEIIVEGNAGNYTGHEMTGGKIFVNGKIGILDENCKGTIYNKGKKMRPKK